MSQCKCDYISYVKIHIMLGQLSQFTVSKAMNIEKMCQVTHFLLQNILCACISVQVDTQFLMGCAAIGLKPLSISKDISPGGGKADLAVFQNFHKLGLQNFYLKKWLILQVFQNFCEMGFSSKEFSTKIGPMFKDFFA